MYFFPINYYEAVFAAMVTDGSLFFQAVSFDNMPWYEIDTIADLAEAEKSFSAGTLLKKHEGLKIVHPVIE